MTDLERLRPQTRQHVMDLVQRAGIDVSDWANCKGGAAEANRNPKYCYRWAFVDRDIVVLNLWYDDMLEAAGTVALTDNLRASSKRRGTKGLRKRRASEFDSAVRFAYENALPVRVIVNQGKRLRGNAKATATARVKARSLDPVLWAVTAYDSTGEFTVTRGVPPAELTDQFVLDPEGESVLQRRSATGEVYVRDPEIRRQALVRAAGKCELCGAPGFRAVGGSVFLETHHIVFLSEGGRDALDNVAALCPNHHREAHHGVAATAIREALLKRVAGKEHRAG